MRVNFNFEEIDKDRLVSEGIHEFEVSSISEQKSKDGAKDLLKVVLDIVDETDSAGANKPLWHYFTIQPNAMWVLRQFANACGVYPGADGLDTDSLLGRRGRAHVLQEKGEGAYAGKLQNNVQEFLPLA
jgi:hypothetical protein